MRLSRLLNYLSLRLVPYLTVAAGLYLFHSAWAALLGYHVGILLVFALTGSWRRLERFKPSGSGDWALGLALPSLLAGLWVYTRWASLDTRHLAPVFLASLGLNGDSWPWFIAYFALINPWLEELYWRGLLGSPSPLPVPDDAWFSAYHLLILSPSSARLGCLSPCLSWSVRPGAGDRSPIARAVYSLRPSPTCWPISRS